MDNDTKDLLMQYLGRYAEHYNIENFSQVTFKKRNDLLEKLRDKDGDAYAVLENLFNCFIKEDRIKNDKEKFDKARVLWESEHAAAEKEKVAAEVKLIQFSKAHHIATGSLSVK